MTEKPLDDDEKLSSLMRSLPQRPLPPGFLQRLERRRRAEGTPKPAAGGYLLPFPARVAAFALSSLIVSLVLYDKVRVMFPVQDMVSGAAVQMLPSTALSVSDVEQARANGTGRRLLRARGEPFDASKGPAFDFKKEPAPQPSNEQLQAGLEAEKRKMGVRAVVAPPPPEVVAMMKLRAGIDAEALKTAPPAPKLEAGTPALLAQQEAAPTRGIAKAARAADGLSGANMPAFAAAGSAAAAAPPAASEAAEGLVLKSADERGKAWNDHGLHAAPPSVNFNVNMIALVVAPDMSTAVEIIGVSTRADRVVVRYRLFPRLAEVASAARSGALVRAYQFRVIPRTEKPVVFSRAE